MGKAEQNEIDFSVIYVLQCIKSSLKVARPVHNKYKVYMFFFSFELKG